MTNEQGSLSSFCQKRYHILNLLLVSSCLPECQVHWTVQSVLHFSLQISSFIQQLILSGSTKPHCNYYTQFCEELIYSTMEDCMKRYGRIRGGLGNKITKKDYNEGSRESSTYKIGESKG